MPCVLRASATSWSCLGPSQAAVSSPLALHAHLKPGTQSHAAPKLPALYLQPASRARAALCARPAPRALSRPAATPPSRARTARCARTTRRPRLPGRRAPPAAQVQALQKRAHAAGLQQGPAEPLQRVDRRRLSIADIPSLGPAAWPVGTLDTHPQCHPLVALRRPTQPTAVCRPGFSRSVVAGRAACSICGPGTFSPGGVSACTPCPVSTTTISPGATTVGMCTGAFVGVGARGSPRGALEPPQGRPAI